jgi:prepilin-type N-terminal cleavage/methylation domain-containing protein
VEDSMEKHEGSPRLEAFTLLEMLIVLTIIGILMAVGMVSYGKMQEMTNKKNVEIEMKNINVAIVTYKSDFGSPPQTVEELYRANIIQKELMTDIWGTDYLLEYQPGSYSVKIISAGPDKKMKTQDDIISEGNI